MFGIVAFHSIRNAGMSNGTLFRSSPSVNLLIVDFFGLWGAFGNICFVIISSYFTIRSKKYGLNSKRLIHLLFQTWLICVGILVACKIGGFGDISISVALKEISTPIYSKQYWFITTYLIFALILPFLKVGAEYCADKVNALLTMILAFLFVIYENIFGLQMGNPGLFIFIFILTDYYCRHLEFFTKHRYSLLLGSWFITSLLTFTLNVAANVSHHDFIFELMDKVFRNTRSPFLILMAFSLFTFFNNLSIKRSRLINTVASGVIGVYIVHENMLLNGTYNNKSAFIWEQVLGVSEIFEKSYFPFLWFLDILIVFALSWILGWVFSKAVDLIMRWTLVRKFCNWIDKKYFCVCPL